MLVSEYPRHSIGFGGENRDEYPRLMRWDRSPSGPDDTVVFTDSHLRDHLQYPAKKRIALLVESPEIRPEIYDWIIDHFDEFDIVLTHQRDLVELGYPFLFYPLGGSWIKEWGMFPKTKMISMLVSPKVGTEGQRLRHKATNLSGIDAYGQGVNRRVESKAEALRDYRFAIIIENTQSDAYFSEKLIDALSQGCVPIYRGCPNIDRFFNPHGMIFWNDFEELEAIVKSLRAEDYERYRQHVKINIEKAQKFRCPEDWITSVYSGVFDG